MAESPDYWRDGYLALPAFVAEPVARAFLAQLKGDLDRHRVDVARLRQKSNLLQREAVELYGLQYPPMMGFLWGMTSTVAAHVGKRLLPTYCYFRVYRQGDICRVHSDRYSCEHSISLMLATSDNQPWPLDMGSQHIDTPRERADADFGDEAHSSVPMLAGDAVLYQGVHRLHGRLTPNPNRWSAHLFLHWVDADGPYAEHAFERQSIPDVAALEVA